ncbi:hypothetical protein AB838_22185 [Rhodobacteraceae bacterium (ex Bugula neritina AB1)]|nr:hypothetical protein AB838_22185 [Rhodobacteraceae bacterium (ex Bugula neritina AB1)]
MILVVYGQQKSASTYLAHLARAVCESSGVPQEALRKRVLTGPLERHRVFWRDNHLFNVTKVADRLKPGENLSIKTHAEFQPRYTEALGRPDVRVLISYRHPGDAALSAFEAGERARREADKNKPFFSAIHSHRGGIDVMARLLERATIPWLKSAMGVPFSYEQITRETQSVLDVLCDLVNCRREALEANDALQALLSGERRVYNFNKGVSGRYKEMFSLADQAYLEERCGKFMRFCEGELPVASL